MLAAGWIVRVRGWHSVNTKKNLAVIVSMLATFTYALVPFITTWSIAPLATDVLICNPSAAISRRMRLVCIIPDAFDNTPFYIDMPSKGSMY
jgi:hypothetical protein